MCLCSATPSQKYGMRGGRGEVVSSFGMVQGPRWTGKGQTSVRVEMLEGGENSLISNYKYMFQRLRDVRDGESMFSLLPSALTQTFIQNFALSKICVVMII